MADLTLDAELDRLEVQRHNQLVDKLRKLQTKPNIEEPPLPMRWLRKHMKSSWRACRYFLRARQSIRRLNLAPVLLQRRQPDLRDFCSMELQRLRMRCFASMNALSTKAQHQGPLRS